MLNANQMLDAARIYLPPHLSTNLPAKGTDNAETMKAAENAAYTAVMELPALSAIGWDKTAIR